MEGQDTHIPRFGGWKSTNGDTPYTIYFEDARKRRNMGSTTTPPKPPLAHGSSVPTNHNADVANPSRPKDPSSRTHSQSTVGYNGGSVPPWGQWNESNAAAGGSTQQYTIVFDQIREERRSAPSTPSIEQLQRPTPARIKHHNQHDHAPKRFTCFGLCGS